MSKITYVVADDHMLFREGLKFALNRYANELECIGEVANGRELLDFLNMHTPNVILLDLKMPEMDGQETIKELKKSYPEIPVIILTMFEDETFVLRLVELDANGYLIKNAEPEEIKNAILTAHKTGYYFNNLMNRAMHDLYITKKSPKKNAIELTEREREILRLLCEEKTTQEIAATLFLSPRTIEGVRAHLMEKFGVKNVVGLVVNAIRNKYVEI